MVVQHGDVRENRTPARRQERERERDLRTHHTQRTFVITSQHYEPMNLHVENILLESCDKIQAHVMSDDCIQQVFRSIVTAKLTYASQAWSDFCTASDINKLDRFLARCKRLNYTEARLLQASLNNLTMQTSLSLEQFCIYISK